MPGRESSTSTISTISSRGNSVLFPAQQEVISSIWLEKRGDLNKSYRKRYCVLRKNSIDYYTDASMNQRPRGSVDQLTTWYSLSIRTDRKNFTLEPLQHIVHGKKRTWHFRYSEEESYDEWSDWLDKLEGRFHSGTAAVPPTRSKLDPNDITIKKQISAAAKVFLGEYTLNSVAIKQLKNLSSFLSEEELRSFYDEVDILHSIHHPQILEMFGWCLKEGFHCLVMEYMPNGDLSRIIEDKSVEFDFAGLLRFLLSISKGMEYLHKTRKAVHRDLKPENILIKDLARGDVKLCDFGLSKNIDTSDEYVLGTPQYAAPELPTDSNFPVDVYSMGIIMWELCHRKRAWKDVSAGYLIAEKVIAGERPPMEEGCKLESQIQACWSADPSLRPTFTDLRKELYNIYITICPDDATVSRATMSLIESPVMVKSLRERIQSIFSDGQYATWNSFADRLAEYLEGTREQVEKLKHCLTDAPNRVSLERWSKFEAQFAPIVAKTDCQSGSTLDNVVSVAGLEWFWGWAAQEEVRDTLRKCSDGMYLLRFSTRQGMLTLSTYSSGTVFHWRLGKKQTSTMEKMRIVVEDTGEDFAGVQEMVDHYTENPLIDRRNVGRSFRLTKPLVRQDATTMYRDDVE
ncbi:SH2 domain-containing protein [Planoprotostelium fungivorum]|uniref:SH2 domain-containing protein n=1 Tax=Planoprotostelium fungivorum TaxID=1890364 RepID=A0A2P6N3S7_9EUKA|nr:SH2 domain-containing protein [Planoprotostelium fungivorum]